MPSPPPLLADFLADPQGTLGGLRPPKLKTEDAEKSYVQRPVSKEEFRPKAAYVPPTQYRK